MTQYVEAPAAPLTIVDGVVAWHTNAAPCVEQVLTLTEHARLEILDAALGAQGYLEVEQDDTGGWLLTLPPGTQYGAKHLKPDPRAKTCIAWGCTARGFFFVRAWEA